MVVHPLIAQRLSKNLKEIVPQHSDLPSEVEQVYIKKNGGVYGLFIQESNGVDNLKHFEIFTSMVKAWKKDTSH